MRSAGLGIALAGYGLVVIGAVNAFYNRATGKNLMKWGVMDGFLGVGATFIVVGLVIRK
jgi:hypothetical protein